MGVSSQQLQKIYLKYSIVKNSTKEKSDYDLLLILQTHLESLHSISGHLSQVNQKWILNFEFENNAQFDEIFSKNMKFYIRLHALKESKQISMDDLNVEEAFSHENPEEVQIILKQQTNRKNPIKENYRLSFTLVEFLNYGADYEEIEDGFLIFYRSFKDFENMQINRLDFQQMKKWLTTKKIWNKKIEAILVKLLEQ